MIDGRFFLDYTDDTFICADIAQLVEQQYRKLQVSGSIPDVGSMIYLFTLWFPKVCFCDILYISYDYAQKCF